MSTPASTSDAGTKDELPALMIRYRTLICVGAHAAACIAALFLSFVLVYTNAYADLKWDYAAQWFVPLFLPLLLLGLPIKLLVFHRTGQYRASWRYVSLRDLFGVISSSLIASFFFLSCYFLLDNFSVYQFQKRLFGRQTPPPTEAWIAFEQGRYREALGLFEGDAETNPDDLDSKVGEVFCYIALDNEPLALARLHELQQSTENPFALDLNLRSGRRLGDHRRLGTDRVSGVLGQLKSMRRSEEEDAEGDRWALSAFGMWYLGHQEFARELLSVWVPELQNREYQRWPELMAGATAAVPPYLKQPVFLLDWALTLALVCAMKVVVRFYFEEGRGRREGEQSRVLIVGAGSDAEALLREILRMRGGRYRCVGLVASGTARHGVIHGVEVLGDLDQLRELCTEHKIDEVLIALPNATPRVIRGLVEQCEGLGVLFRTVPPMTDLIEGRVTVSQVRDVDIADLLGRAEVELDEEGIGQQLRGQRVLVTGAGGSIGSEMCRQIAKFSPSRLILIDQAENALFEIDREIRKQFPELDVVPYVADVIDRPRLGTIFGSEKPSVVFHAAAHKHVPMMERNPGEAIKNNVMGTIAVADMAAEHGVGRMVMISTDKAVNPTSIMGCTKRVAEIYVQALNGRVKTQFVTVRFGNVLGSSGSVVPIFKQQIAAGGPVTVTHPEMTRYFMTIPEASQLVLQAGAMGKGGEIYVLHMGEPVKIVDLARDMIALSGLKPGIDIEINFSGIRPGEKLFEELMIDGENVSETSHPKIGIWRPCLQDWDSMLGGVQRLRALADDSTNGQIQEELGRIVPEYNPGDPAATPTKSSDADAVSQT